MKSPRKSIVLAVAGVAAAGMVLSGCSASGGSAGGKTEIVVASVQPGASAAALAAFQTQVKTFEKKNPDIIVKARNMTGRVRPSRPNSPVAPSRTSSAFPSPTPAPWPRTASSRI